MRGVTAMVALVLASCSSDSGSSGGGQAAFSFSATAPAGSASATLAVAWVVSSGSPDYTYSFGSGSLSGATFQVTFATDPPPAEALNSYGVGVGLIVAYQAGTSVPQGKIDFGALEPKLLGLSARHAVIYKKADASTIEWATQFPTGYSCGVCGPPPSGSLFDTYAPVDCSTVKLDLTGTEESCNWT